MVFDILKVNKSIYRGFRTVRVHLVHQKIDINTIMSKICYPSKTKKKRLYIGQFELLLYIILTSDNILDREPRTVIHVKRAKRFDPMG